MTQLFSTWLAALDAAADLPARRQLLGRIAVARATQLHDIPAQRAAAFALSRLYEALGEPDNARLEAQQLVSLCDAPPAATQEERELARQTIGRLRGKRPGPSRAGQESARAPRGAKNARSGTPASSAAASSERRGRASAATPPVPEPKERAEDVASAHLLEGRFDAAREALQGRRGPRAGLLRTWIEVLEVAAAPEAERLARLDALKEALLARLAGPAAPAGEAPTLDVRSPAGDAATAALAAHLGMPVPASRDELVAAIEGAADADAVAAAALHHHVTVHGERAPAPWLFTATARALATTDGAATRAALRELSARGAWAVTAYNEPPFRALVTVWAAAARAGASSLAVRRGVLRRGEPADARVWTLRIEGGDLSDGLVAAAPAYPQGLDEELAARLAQRLGELAPRAVLLAPDASDSTLRAAALALGVAVAASPDEALPALARVAPRPVPARAQAADGRSGKAAAPQAEGAPAAPAAGADAQLPARRGPSPLAVLAQLFEGDELPTREAYEAPLRELRRIVKAFTPLREAIAARAAEEVDARLAPLLEAVDAVAPAGLFLGEGLSVAVRAAVAAPEGLVRSLLTGGGSVAARFGGPGLADLLHALRTASGAGFRLGRVSPGLSRREREAIPALAALEGDLGGLWRVELFAQSGAAVELVWLSALTPAGLVATPQLLAQPGARVVVAEPDAAAVAGQGAVAAGDDDALRAALAGLAEAAPASGSAEPADAPASAAPAPEAPTSVAPAAAEPAEPATADAADALDEVLAVPGGDPA